MKIPTVRSPLSMKKHLKRFTKRSKVTTIPVCDDDYATCSTLHCSELSEEKTTPNIEPWESLCDLSEASTASSASQSEIALWESLCDFSEIRSTTSSDCMEEINEGSLDDEIYFQNNDEMSYYSTSSASYSADPLNLPVIVPQCELLDVSLIKYESTQKTCNASESRVFLQPLPETSLTTSFDSIDSIDTLEQSSLSDESTDLASVQTSLQGEDKHKLSISKSTEGMFSAFLESKRKFPHSLLSRSLKRKLFFCIISIVYVLICFKYRGIFGAGSDDDDNDSSSEEKVYSYDSPITSIHSEVSQPVKKFSLYDLQHVLFWFILFTKVQELFSKVTPQRRIRRSWKSHLIPLN